METYLKEEEELEETDQNKNDLSNLELQERFLNLILPGFKGVSESSMEMQKSEVLGISFDDVGRKGKRGGGVVGGYFEVEGFDEDGDCKSMM